MEYNDVKRCMLGCRDLAGLGEPTAAVLFWRGETQALEEGETIYSEGTTLDGTFCLLLSGRIVIEKASEIIGEISEGEIFGEMAYFTHRKTRTATVRVGSPQAVVLKFKLTLEELADPCFSGLRRYLSWQTWQKFVRASQGLITCQAK